MNSKKDKPMPEILQRDEAAELLQRDEVAEVLLSNNVAETLHNIEINITQTKENVNSNCSEEKEEGLSDKDNDLKALFLITEFQRATIGVMRERIDNIMELMNRIVTNMEKRENKYDRLSTINKGMEARIKALEEEAEFRAVKIRTKQDEIKATQGLKRVAQ